MPNYRYVPILRWKAGEQEGLSSLAPVHKAGTEPVILLTSEQYAATKSPPKTPPKRPRKVAPPPASDAFVAQLEKAWGSQRILVDASDLTETGDTHHLDRIAASARAAHLDLVPATWLAAASAYQDAVRRMVSEDDRGVAVRVTLAEMTSAENWLKSWPYSPSSTDLIVDLGLGVGDVASLGIPALTAFSNLYEGPNWRSVTVAGGSIPQMLSGFTIGSTLVPRRELAFWGALVQHGLPYRIDFGDYANVTADPLAVDVPGGSFPINAKYTLKDSFFVRHGVRPKADDAATARSAQFKAHAKAIKALDERDRLSDCWGDDRIDDIADGTSTPGNPAKWVAYTVNRHIARTRRDLP